ncbi:ATP-binding protein [Fulvivirga lutea]|uniref:Tetratricopeptide repeat protein n=1 Tax=Fulvivirga lutea TaxID=2810512 RepID=A0A974WK94_9BACT|nr:tetratricopeptide repeat protein [Fulvivirga lutea]QSE97700.1 tetratricopeptide repeat protein [Fulvivirga lutea]
MKGLILPVIFSCFLALAMLISTASYGQQTNIDKQALADSLYAQRLYVESAQLYSELFEELNEQPEQLGKIAYSAGNAFARSGDSENALVWYEKASHILKEAEAWDNYFIAQAKIADLHDEKGDYTTAITLGEKVINHFMQQKDSVYAAKTLHNLALYYYHNNNLQKAIDLLSQSVGWIGNKDDFQKAISYNQLGNIWADDLGDERKALHYYLKSLQFKLKGATPQSISASYNNVGISYKNLNQPDSALFYYQKALESAIESNIPRAQFNPLTNLANLYKREGEIEKATKTYEKVLLLKDYMTAVQQVDIHINLGAAYNQWQKYDDALKHLLIAEELGAEVSSPSDHALIQSQKAVAYSNTGNYEKAFAAQIAYTTLKDSIYAREKRQEIGELMIKFETAEKDLLILEQQKAMQQQELELQKRTTLFIAIFTIILIISGVLFYLFKRKEAAAQKAELELRLTEQQELTRIQQERLRISRELHDNIGSYLTLMSASVEQFAIAKEVINDKKITELKGTLAMSMRELRKTVWLLNKQAVSIDEITLRLRDFFKPLHQNGTRISVDSEGNGDYTLTEIQATHLIRIIQEAINNAYKYAACKQIDVKLKTDNSNTFHFSVADNGKGFNAQTVEHGNGLHNMRSRIEELNGDLEIFSEAGKGTEVKGSFKLKEYE